MIKKRKTLCLVFCVILVFSLAFPASAASEDSKIVLTFIFDHDLGYFVSFGAAHLVDFQSSYYLTAYFEGVEDFSFNCVCEFMYLRSNGFEYVFEYGPDSSVYGTQFLLGWVRSDPNGFNDVFLSGIFFAGSFPEVLNNFSDDELLNMNFIVELTECKTALDVTTDSLVIVLDWIQVFLTSLMSGVLSPALGLLAVGISISGLFLVVKIIRSFTWGS